MGVRYLVVEIFTLCKSDFQIVVFHFLCFFMCFHFLVLFFWTTKN